MTNIWDSIPASAWPTQVTPWLPFDPMQSAPWPRQTAPSWDASAPRRFGWLHTSAVPMRAQPGANRNDSNAISGSFSAADIPDPAYTARQLEDHDTVLGPPHDASPFGTILRALFGGARDSSSSSAAQPSPQYGVVPKNFPPEYRLPAAVSDWQRPESEFTFPLDSPHTLALIKKWLAAGLPPDRIVLDDTTARLRRDNARMADLLFPGSGNFVSGDWNNINEGDVANLLFSVASTILPPGRAAGPARTAVRGVRAAAEAEAAARAATSIGPVVGNRVLAGERLVTFPEATRLILYDEGAKMLQQLDARNRLLRIPTSSDWVPSLGGQAQQRNQSCP